MSRGSGGGKETKGRGRGEGVKKRREMGKSVKRGKKGSPGDGGCLCNIPPQSCQSPQKAEKG